MILYRPVGLEELRLVHESALAAFPPRLPDQPIFYPVLNAEYAARIARLEHEEPSSCRYVTRFEVDDAFAGRYEIHNQHIAPPIRVTEGYFGDGFKGLVPANFMLAGRDAVEQFVTLEQILAHGGFDFICEVGANHVAVFLHYPFWTQRDFSAEGVLREP